MRQYDLQMTSVELTPAKLATYDCVLIATHHSSYDWPMIAKHSRLIVDTRGAMRRFTDLGDKIVQA
jgi:UDP-N-acetyl-D-glucosamine dehydrogenase